MDFPERLKKVAVELTKMPKDPFSQAVVTWQKKPTRKNLRPVLQHVRPYVSKRSRDYPMLGKEVTTAELTKAALKGLKRYNPNRGASASTWTVTSMKAARRNLLRRATPLRIPDSRLQMVGKFQRGTADGKSGKSLSKSMGISGRILGLLGKEVKSVKISSKEEIPHGKQVGRAKEVWDLLRPELTGKEQKVYDALRKNPKITTGALAKKLKISPSSVSTYKRKIRTKMRKHL